MRITTSKRLTGLALTVLLVAVAAPAPSAFAETRAPLSFSNTVPPTFGAVPERVAGDSRYLTAIEISKKNWTSSTYVVLATGEHWPDALVANPLAAALGAPILTTPPTHLDSDVLAEMRRLGATEVIVVGSVNAVSGQVVSDLVGAGFALQDIERIGGSDRFDTSVRVAERVMIQRGVPPKVVMATGLAYPDALAVAGYAARAGMPILLTQPGFVPAATAREIDLIDPEGTIIVGGEAAISSSVASTMPSPERIGGDNRYDTARLIAEYAFAHGMTYDSVVVATGTDYADALVAGPWVSAMEGMMILTDPETISAETDLFFNDHSSSVDDIYVVGSPAAVRQDVVDDIRSAAESRMNADEIELMSGAADSALETITPDGTLTFDDTQIDPASIQTSDVLVAQPTAKTPEGYLRRVLSVTQAGGKVTIETTQATLADVIEKGSIDVTGTIETDDVGSAGAMTMTDARSVDPTHVDVEFDGLQMEAARIDPRASLGSADIRLDRTLYESGDLEVRTEGNIHFDGAFTFNASFGYLGYWSGPWWGRYPVFGLREVKFVAYLNQSLSLNLISELTIASFEKEIELAEFRLPSPVVWVGPVPIYIENTLTPVVGVSASLGAGLDVSVYQWARASLGIRWRHTSGWSPIRSWSSGYSYAVSGAVTANARAWLGARIDSQLYGVAGPYFQPEVFLEFDAATNANPWWTLDAGLAAQFGGAIDVLGKRSSFGWTYELYRRRLAQAPGAWPSMQAAPAAGETVPPAVGHLPAQAEVMPASLTASITASSLDASDFSIDGLTVTDAQLQPDGATVRLTTSAQTPGQSYSVGVDHGSIVNGSGQGVVAGSGPFVGYYPLTVQTVSAVDATTVDVTFDSYAELSTSTVDVSDFSLPGVSVSDATVQPDGRTVRLVTAAQPRYKTLPMTLAADAIQDEAGFPSDAASPSLETFTVPAIEYTKPIDSTTVDVTWESFSDLTGVDTSDFSIAGLTVSDAVLQPDGRTVRLTTTAQTAGGTYAVDSAAGSVSNSDGSSIDTTAGLTGYSTYGVGGTTINPSGKSIYNIRGFDSDVAYGTGMEGYVFKTTNGGATWTNTGGRASWNSYDVAFPDPSDPDMVMLSSFGGYLNRTTNGGSSWSQMNLSALIGHCEGVDFAGSTGKGIAVDGGNILKSTDLGATWTEHPQEGTGLVGMSIRFANDTRGYIGSTAGRVWRTDDSGDTWTQLTTPASADTLGDIWTSADDPDHVVAVGAAGYILTSFDGGETWLTPSSGTAEALNDIDFATQDLGVAVGGDAVILVTRDGGRSWETVRAAGGGAYLSGVWARDANNIWVGGLNGLAYKVTGS